MPYHVAVGQGVRTCTNEPIHTAPYHCITCGSVAVCRTASVSLCETIAYVVGAVSSFARVHKSQVLRVAHRPRFAVVGGSAQVSKRIVYEVWRLPHGSSELRTSRGTRRSPCVTRGVRARNVVRVSVQDHVDVTSRPRIVPLTSGRSPHLYTVYM